jgi:acyl-CoA synthetase (NDP forming)/GNAT superfamily N-acetyltransferase
MAVQARQALLTDGRIVSIRQLVSSDTAVVLHLHERLPDRDRYLRFFTLGPARLAAFAVRLTTADDAHRGALGAFIDGELIGVAHYEVLDDPAKAEIALVVNHAIQAQGVGTLLLEHLVSLAHDRGVRRFVAEVLAENHRMVEVFWNCGLTVSVHYDGPVVHVSMPLELDERYLDAVTERERRADSASLRSVLTPHVVAVIGASRREDSIGHAILRRIGEGGFTGRLFAVNPHATEIAGIPSYANVTVLPETPDLAVVCVPAPAVPGVAEECGHRGVRALLVITAGITGDEPLRRALLDAVRQYGMRLIGPNCLGLVNTDPQVRLAATFSDRAAPNGPVGVATQSGGTGIALLDQLGHLGLGVSTLVSLGDKYDVSSNDLLRWWLSDECTEVAVLYLESFGNPHKFSRLARRLAQRKPVIALRTGTTEAAQQAAASHTAAAATPAATRDALYRQAGVIAVDTLTELYATTALLCWQPLPAGPAVVVLSNAGGAGVLAADACVMHDLDLLEPSESTRARLRKLLPPQASLHNPIDTTAGINSATFGACLEAVLADDTVHAVVAIAAPTALGDPAIEITQALDRARGKGITTPVLAVQVSQPEVVHSLKADSGHPVPSYADPAVAVHALAHAVRYGQWRTRPAGRVPDLPGISVDQARTLVRQFLTDHPDGGWLSPPTAQALLCSFGLPVLTGTTATDETEAVTAFRQAGGPIALKAVARGVLHKSRHGGVILGIRDEQQLRTELAALRQRFRDTLEAVFVQPMAAPGRELLIGINSDRTFGPLVVFGLGGVDTDLIADRACRLVPLTDVDADEMMRSLRCFPALFDTEQPHRPDIDAVHDMLLRIGRLAELLPEVTELDLNPVTADERGCLIVDARILLRPAVHEDPLLRRLGH